MKRTIAVRMLAMATLLLAGGFCGGCSVSPATGEMQLMLISRQQEIEMGAQAAPEIEKQLGGLVKDQRIQDYVGQVGKRLAEGAEREMPYEFAVVGSDTPNAFALPGGKIYVTAGLMKHFAREQHLAAVLGHEIGHVTDRHNVQGIQRSMGVRVFADLAAKIVGADAAAAAKIGAQVAGSMILLRYSRENEYTADALGIRYLARAGYDPNAMVEMLKILQNLSGDEGNRMAEMFRTHPLTTNRIEHAEMVVGRDHPAAERTPMNLSDDRFLAMRRRLIAAMEDADDAEDDAPSDAD